MWRASRITLAVAVVAVAGCDERTASAPPTTSTPEPLVPVAAVADPQAVTLGYVGVLTPRGQAEVVAPFTTTVVSYLVNLGDVVAKGTPLARLDDVPLREQLGVTRAELSRARLAQAAASAALDKERQTFAAGVSSQSAVTEAELRVSEAAARVEGAKATVAAVEKKLSETRMLSPLDGKVALRYVEAGGRVEEGRPVLRVISSDQLFVKFALPLERSGSLAVGDRVDVQIESAGAKVATTATVRRIAPELDPIAQMILVEADLPSPPPTGLQAGLVCRVREPSRPE